MRSSMATICRSLGREPPAHRSGMPPATQMSTASTTKRQRIGLPSREQLVAGGRVRTSPTEKEENGCEKA